MPKMPILVDLSTICSFLLPFVTGFSNVKKFLKPKVRQPCHFKSVSLKQTNEPKTKNNYENQTNCNDHVSCVF